MSLPVFTFQPVLKVTPWGGHRLLHYKEMDSPLKNVGESWEISGIEGSESIVDEGQFKGLTLTELISRYKERLVGKKVYETFGTHFPLLIKFIDTDQKLSIQVHPDDIVARQRGFRNGKTEMWYIVDAEPDAILLKGFKRAFDKDEYIAKAQNGEILNEIAEHKVHRGDCFYIPAGQVHAICEGIMLIEVQQTSDTTYRIFDYNRPGLDGKPRKLHLQESLGAVSLKPLEGDSSLPYDKAPNRCNNIVSSPYFKTGFVHLTESKTWNLENRNCFVILIPFEGGITVDNGGDGQPIDLVQGHTALVPAETQQVRLKPTENGCKFLVVTI